MRWVNDRAGAVRGELRYCCVCGLESVSAKQLQQLSVIPALGGV